MKLKSGKEEIVYLVSKVIDKYESETGDQIIRNTNRKNYEKIGRILSEISNNLPFTSEELDHAPYPVDEMDRKLEYPFRKFDITSSQLKDACLGIVNNPRDFLVDACYIYLFGVGRRGFEKNPTDKKLIEEVYHDEDAQTDPDEVTNLKDINVELEKNLSDTKKRLEKTKAILKRRNIFLFTSILILISCLLAFILMWHSSKANWETMKRDMSILPYTPTQQEIDSLEGVWLCYTASPQARSSNPYRYHLVVFNVVDVKYKDGYFTFNRYGASFNHEGYMQFEAPWLVSIHSLVRNNKGDIESPRHSLMRLDKGESIIPVISASWNFDAGEKNNIIGIREVYIKQGKGGSISEVLNTLENAKCGCKIVQWDRKNTKPETFYLKNELLDSLSNPTLKSMLERSILPREPNANLLIEDDKK